MADTLTRVLDQTAACVVVTDADGIIEYVNPAYESLTGFSREEAVGHSPGLVRSGVQTPAFYQTMWATLASGSPFHATLTNRARDGRLFQYEQTISPIVDDAGRITHYVGIGHDVTKRLRGEAARLLFQLEDEATRTAGLLHEEAGQYLALAHMTLADLARTLPAAEGARIVEVRGYLDYIERRLREVSRGIQPRVIADLGLIEAVRFLATGFEKRHGVVVTIDAALDIQCPASIESLLYGFVRDTLMNVGAHGRATQVDIVLAREVNGRRAQDKTVTCVVRDNGCGFDVSRLEAQTGGALKSLRLRFAGIGGQLTVESVPGEGTMVRAIVPLDG